MMRGREAANADPHCICALLIKGKKARYGGDSSYLACGVKTRKHLVLENKDTGPVVWWDDTCTIISQALYIGFA